MMQDKQQIQQLSIDHQEYKPMKELVEHIVNKDHVKANELLEQHLSDIVESKMNEVKKMIAARMDEQVSVQNDGMVHTAAGEELLPSVYRQRRQLAEGKWSKKRQLTPAEPESKPSTMTPERKAEIRAQAAAKVAKRTQKAAEKESKEKRVKISAKFLKRRELLKGKIKSIKYKAEQRKKAQSITKTAEQKSKAAKAAEITREADPYTSVKEKIKKRGELVGTIFGPTAQSRYEQEKLSKMRPRLPKDKYAQLSVFGKLKNKLGLDEESDNEALRKYYAKDGPFESDMKELAKKGADAKAAAKARALELRRKRNKKSAIEEAKKEELIDPRTGKPFKYRPIPRSKETQNREYPPPPPYTEEDRKRDVAAALRPIPKNPEKPLSDHERMVRAALLPLPRRKKPDASKS
jgi:hypothetical protein